MGGRAGRRPKPERERAIYYQVEQKGFGALYVGTRLVICEIGLSQDRRQAGPFGALSSASAPDRARIAGDPQSGMLRTLCLRCLTTQREFGPPGRIWFNLSWLGAAAGDVGDVETGEVSTKNDLF